MARRSGPVTRVDRVGSTCVGIAIRTKTIAPEFGVEVSGFGGVEYGPQPDTVFLGTSHFFSIFCLTYSTQLGRRIGLVGASMEEDHAVEYCSHGCGQQRL